MKTSGAQFLPPSRPDWSAGQGGVISVVLPAFNEAQALPSLVPTILQLLKGTPFGLEIVVIDDGSTDATTLVMRSLCQQIPQLRYLRLSRNFGKEAAITAGLQYAIGDAVILMDADGQHPIEMLLTFIERWQAGADSVVAVQIEREEPRLQRWAKGKYYKLLNSASAIDMRSGAGDFRLLDRRVVNQINSMPERNRFMKGLYSWVGFNTVWLEYQAQPRQFGASHYGWKGLVRLGLTGFTAFSVIPLRLVSALGLIVSVGAFFYGLYLGFEHFSGHQLPGWATLAVGTMLLAGVQLLSLGVIAEYVGRIFDEVKQRPLFIVAEHISSLSSAGSHATTSSVKLNNPLDDPSILHSTQR